MSGDKKRKLPEGWKWEKLKQLGSLSQGGTPSTDMLEYWNGNFPFITGADVTELYVSNARSFLTEKGLDSGKTQKCEKGDLLIVSRTRVGRVGIAAITLGVSQDVSVLKTKVNYHAKYLAMFLNHISKQLEEACQGSTIKGLTRGYIENISIPIPPTPAGQLAIASDLERRIAHVEKMRGAALRQKEAIAAMQGSILREAFPYEEGDELPEGWKLRPLKDNCFINPSKRKGFTREPNAQTSFVPMEAVDEDTGKITHIIKRNYFEISKGYTFFEEGDVLFAKITPCMQNGKSAIAQDLIDGVGFGSTEFHVLRPKKDITKEWIYFYVRTAEFRQRAKDHFEGSAGQQRVSTYFIENSLIPLPPTLFDQIAIAAELERKMAELEKARQAAQRQVEAIEALPGAILHEVFDFDKESAGASGVK